MDRSGTTAPNPFQSLGRAFDYALELHGSQRRKRDPDAKQPGVPYIAHLMSVAALVLEHGGSEEDAIAALLHDGPEDRGGEETLETIRRRFGGAVAETVAGCTDTMECPKPSWSKRKLDYIEHLTATEDDSTFLVSLADKVHNVRSILSDYRRFGPDLWRRFNQGRDGTLWYYHQLLETFEHRAPERCESLIRELARSLTELDQLVAEREAVRLGRWRDLRPI